MSKPEEHTEPWPPLFSPALLERSAYDIRGSVGIAHLSLEEIATSLGADVDENQRTLLQRGRRGMRKLLRVAERLLRVAQLASTPLQLHTSRVEVGRTIELSVGDAISIEARPEIDAQLVLSAAPQLVEADPMWLSIAISEVVGAAIRHAKTRVRVELLVEAAGPIILVEDDGIHSVRDRDVFQDLPLALADACMRVHQWRLLRESELAGGSDGIRSSARVVLQLHRPL